MFLIAVGIVVLIRPSLQLPQQVILDVDGGIDDFHALTYLLNADTQKIIKIVGILCTKGNTALEHVENNVIRFLDTAGRLDIPIYSGAFRPHILPEEPLIQWFGIDGLADLQYKRNPNRNVIRRLSAIQFLIDSVKSNPNKIVLIAIGPLSNAAMAATLREDFMKDIKEIFIMGGNYGEAVAEFNFLGDPEAAHAIFDTIQKPTTILTWEACLTAGVNLGWRLNITQSNPLWNLIDAAEKKLYSEANLSDVYTACDGITALAFLHPNLVKKSSNHCASVEVKDEATYGQIIIKSGCRNNVKIIEEIDGKFYEKLFVDGFKNACVGKWCFDKYL